MDYNPLDKGLLADINVTPFVDVMLVLLIIFMVTAPMMEQGVEVDLPRTETVQTLPEDSDHVVLSVKEDGSLYLDQYEVKLEKLSGHLRKLAQNKDNLLYLRADGKVPYGKVVDIMGRVKEAGIKRLGVVAEEEGD